MTREQLRIDSTGNNTKMLIMKAQRKMTGKYVLTAKNEHGEDSVEIDIAVLGKLRVILVKKKKKGGFAVCHLNFLYYLPHFPHHLPSSLFSFGFSCLMIFYICNAPLLYDNI